MTAAPATFAHLPVLLEETLALLAPRSGGTYADATVGGGGHASAILDASAPDGRLIGLDRDARAIEAARERLAPYGERVRLVHAEFARIGEVLRDCGTERVNGLVADLGVSSPQLDDAGRGFSFMREGPLDMRMDAASGGETARELVERLNADELADVLYQFGDERRSRAIARAIRRAADDDRLHTTSDLRRAVVSVLGPARHRRIDPATRTFQALRIAVNREMEQLEALLAQLPEVLDDEGVAVLISFHSLEDGTVKRALRADERLEALTKKPRAATFTERRANLRARSAKLRAARRVPRAAEDATAEEPR